MVQSDLFGRKRGVTAQRVRQLLSYNPNTGECRWLVVTSNRIRPGQLAGANSRGYRTIGIDGHRYLLHRIIWLYMTGDWPLHEIDHINCNRGDNRWCNLREATSGQNSRNMPKLKNNTSGHAGVSWDRKRSKWYTYIETNGARKHLGRFTNKSDAIAARRAAEIEHFGEFRYRGESD